MPAPGRRRYATVSTFGWPGRVICTLVGLFPLWYVYRGMGLLGLLLLGVPLLGPFVAGWLWQTWAPRGERPLTDEECARVAIERAMRDTSPPHQAFAPRASSDPAPPPAAAAAVEPSAATSPGLHPGLPDPRTVTPF